MLLKVCKESRVSEVLQARSVVCHDIVYSSDEERGLAIPVLALVQAGKATQGGCRSVRAYRAFCDAG